MTDRMKGCVVSFDRDIREDDVELLVNAIKMIKGVLSVELSVADIDDHINRDRIRHDVQERLWKASKSNLHGGYLYDLVEKPK